MNETTRTRTPRWIAAGLLALTLSPAAASEPADPTAAADQAVERASDLIADGRPGDAEVLLGRALDWDSRHLGALRLRGELTRKAGRLDEALSDYETIVALDSEAAEAWFWVGTIHRWQGRPEEALGAFGEALSRAPDHGDSLKGRARVLIGSDRPDEAESDLKRWLEVSPADEEGSILLAETLLRSGQVSTAEMAMAGAFQGAELACRFGRAAHAAARPEVAEEAFRRALDLGADEAPVQRALGHVWVESGPPRRAFEAFRRAEELAPGDLGSLYWIGVLATRLGEQRVAGEAFEAMLEIEPGNVGALVGLARSLRYSGRRERALALVSKALAADPVNSEALVLRASLLSESGQIRQAREDYQTALAHNPTDGDALIGYQRLALSSAWGVSGLSDRSRVVEGLDDEGLVVDGNEIRPTRLEYITEGGELTYRSLLGSGSNLELDLEQRREAVVNLAGGSTIYDLDVQAARAGLRHRLSSRWRLGWHLGATSYSPRDDLSIEETNEPNVGLAAQRTDGRTELQLAVERSPYIHRGFAGDTQFRIFSEDRLEGRLSVNLAGHWRLDLRGGVSDFGDGNTPGSGSVGLVWIQGARRVNVGFRHSPFPERFLTATDQLEFVDLDGFEVAVDLPLDAGFRVTGDLLLGRYGPTERAIESGGVLVAGPLERNGESRLRAEVSWAPPRADRLRLGLRYLKDEFDFDTGVYNTINAEATGYFVELGDNSAARRLNYRLRAGQSFVEDDRDTDYTLDDLSLRLGFRLGRLDGAPVQLNLEGDWSEAILEGLAGQFAEQRPRVRLFLSVPRR